MGAGHNKDGFVDMMIETNKPFYTAGECVDGVVHINCKAARNYRALIVKLQGKERVRWSEGSGKHRRHYSNSRDTYSAAFDVAIFENGIIGGGRYTFPFKFLLSAQFPGSMYESDSCYIRYPLSAELLSSDGKNDTQVFTKILNILQPLRQPFGLIQKQQISTPQCCGCCSNYGVVKIGMSCDKNFVRTGDSVTITGYIDNTGGKEKIDSIQINFIERRWKVSSGGAIRNHEMNSFKFYVHANPVQAGSSDQFTTNATIPGGLVYSTAIGSILSRYYTLTLSSSMGCCSNSPFCQIPLVFQTVSQKIEISEKIPPPPIWTPVIANEVVCNSLPPFIYQPDLSMPHLNRSGTNNISNLNNMSNKEGYMPQINMSDLSVYS